MKTKTTKRTIIIVSPSSSGRRFCTSLTNKIFSALGQDHEVVIRLGDNKIHGADIDEVFVDEAVDEEIKTAYEKILKDQVARSPFKPMRFPNV